MNEQTSRNLSDVLQHRFIKIEDLVFHVVVAGPEDAPPVILLHGFPDAWFGWKFQIDQLLQAGYRVIIPDQRGYNLSSKPKGYEHYRIETLGQDIVKLADSLNIGKFSLAGHDWGAAVSWYLAEQWPERITHLAIINVPHPSVMISYLKKHPKQMMKSWYIFLFQVPRLAEFLARLGNWQMMLSALPPHLPNDLRAEYREAWSQEGAITGMINWYRAMLRTPRTKNRRDAKIVASTLIIWGRNDRYLSYEMAELSLDRCESAQLVTLEASHWVMLDDPEAVGKLLVEHFQSPQHYG